MMAGTSLGVGSPNDRAQTLRVYRDAGTRISERVDLRTVVQGTSLASIRIDGRLAQQDELTLMGRIERLAPLSRRDWATVFGVSHTLIGKWLRSDPPREELRQVLELLVEAAPFHQDLAAWLRTEVPGIPVTPRDLLAARRWSAFRGAIIARPAPPVGLSDEEIAARRRADHTWFTADVPAGAVDE